MFAPPFNRQCQKVEVTRNEWDDRIMGPTATLQCHFRQIDFQTRINHGEQNDADAMVWFAAGTNISLGDTIIFDSVYYQVEKITKAVRLGEDTVQFIKCDLQIIDLGLS